MNLTRLVQMTKDGAAVEWLMAVDRTGLALSEAVAPARTTANDDGDVWRFAAPRLGELLSVFRAGSPETGRGPARGERGSRP